LIKTGLETRTLFEFQGPLTGIPLCRLLEAKLPKSFLRQLKEVRQEVGYSIHVASRGLEKFPQKPKIVIVVKRVKN
jgi:hypothetical protein